jgi:hypothetical protein
MFTLAVSVVLALPPGPQAAQQPPPPPAPPAAVQRQAPPPPYNPKADARAQIAAALKSAKEDGIRVLITWGSNDDEHSTAFAAMRRNRELATFFSQEYKLVNVDVGALERNLDVASAHGVSLDAKTIPMVAVLDADGRVLARASGRTFAAESDPAAYDAARFAAFLKSHQAPPPPDAEPILAAAVAQAKREGKAVFVWFSAPW